MDAWPMIIRLTDEELMTADERERADTIVRSASLARIIEPREVVGAAIMDRLGAGVSMTAALDLVEELVAIRHNRMLIEAGRRGLPDDEGGDTRILLWPVRRSHPTFAA